MKDRREGSTYRASVLDTITGIEPLPCSGNWQKRPKRTLGGETAVQTTWEGRVEEKKEEGREEEKDRKDDDGWRGKSVEDEVRM